MTRVADEPQSWTVESDPETVVRDMREGIEAAKARLSEHRAQMQAAGLARRRDPEPAEPR
jgi:hypothetical protein